MFYEITIRCVGCTLCAQRCPAGAIAGHRRQQHVIDPSVCKECGACWRQCPKAAIVDPQGRRRRGRPVKELPKAWIDAGSCVGCQTCRLNCPFDAVSFEPSRLSVLSSMGRCRVLHGRCQGCAGCIASCPTGAALLCSAGPQRQRAAGGG